MIRLSHIIEQITELGDIFNPFSWDYDFEDDDGNIFYSFDTPKHTYSVAFTPHGVDRYELFFNTEGDMGQDTEEGVAMRVLSTIVEITNSFIKKRNPLEIIFRPIKTKGTDDNRRFKVYGVYLKKNLPSSYDLITVGDTYRWIQK
jgi:hypothetical protein